MGLYVGRTNITIGMPTCGKLPYRINISPLQTRSNSSTPTTFVNTNIHLDDHLTYITMHSKLLSTLTLLLYTAAASNTCAVLPGAKPASSEFHKICTVIEAANITAEPYVGCSNTSTYRVFSTSNPSNWAAVQTCFANLLGVSDSECPEGFWVQHYHTIQFNTFETASANVTNDHGVAVECTFQFNITGFPAQGPVYVGAKDVRDIVATANREVNKMNLAVEGFTNCLAPGEGNTTANANGAEINWRVMWWTVNPGDDSSVQPL
ncbi:Uu.00g140760.m01.CDS01 [Anthostomella pinea]|uniref:Uu.00g140760.m01.CDS01 n=1 Tax=Anthostomella pinea TaxID=933095 RepID=A0AAI8YLJ4_9PEZI|nr:Uu.00g140760.m01.CDS01 [Anthostomella pinea]